MTEIVETPIVVRQTVLERQNGVLESIKHQEAVVERLTVNLRAARERLVHLQIEAEDLAIWLERNNP